MSEIEKMYENAGIEKVLTRTNAGKCYPPFTAEKQLELIKWLGKYDYFEVYYRPVQKDWIIGSKTADCSHYDFTLGLASWIVDIWQDLTEQERTEIAEILRG